MRPRRLALVAIAVLPASLAAQAVSDDGRAISWQGTIANGALVRTENVNGEVRIVTGRADRVVVKGTRVVRRGDPGLVRLETHRRGDGGLTLCVVQPRQRCGDQGIEGRSDDRGMRDSDVRIDLVIEVPAGSPIHGETVNGSVRVVGAMASVKAESVNGEVVIEGGDGELEAETLNGSITMRPGGTTRGGRWSAEAVNGSVTVDVPPGAGMDVDIATVNGDVRSDVPITVRGRMERGELRGRVGDGGRALRIETVNGSITLRQRR